MIVNKQKTIQFEKSRIAEKIIKALVIGISIPLVLSSPYAAVGLVKAARYYFRKMDFNREVKRLQKRGYVALTKSDRGWVLKLLPKGRTRANQIAFKNLNLPKPKTWDGKWRLFSFDIPEEHSNARNLIRNKLKSLGFHNIQRSLFAYPYDCKRELELVVEHYKVSKYTLFVETAFIDLDSELRKFFKV
jgi:hypothetical protein